MIKRKERDDFYIAMGFRLKQIRQVKKISQQELADALGVVMQTIQKYESGEIRMLPEIIQQCAQTFTIPVGYFYGEGNAQKFTRVSLMVASEVMMLPNDDIRKGVYSLAKIINAAWEQDNQNK